MNVKDPLTDIEFDNCLLKANTDWRKRLRKESRCVHYDYESDILQLKFGTPGLIILHRLDSDDEEFEWVLEDESLRIVGVEIFYFREDYAPRYPKLLAAYGALCQERGTSDWHINLPPQADTKEPIAATAFADTLLDCARDPVPVPD